MLASTLIKLLGEAVAEHGDLHVFKRDKFFNRAVVVLGPEIVRVRLHLQPERPPMLLLDHEEKDRVH